MLLSLPMGQRDGFSFSSVILSYFLVGGGLGVGTLLVGLLQPSSEYAGYLVLGGGAFLGGWVAARASHGSTIIEPVIGAIAVVATMVGLAAGTVVGQHVWSVAQDATMKFIGVVGGVCAGGALVGAFISEKLMGAATQSSLPWILYAGMAAFGACLLATLVAALALASGGTAAAGIENVAIVMMVGSAAGCLLSGLSVGASARTRPLIAAFLGGALGVAGYFYVLSRPAVASAEKDAAAGIAVLAAGGAVVMLLGAAIGWAAIGKRNASYLD